MDGERGDCKSRISSTHLVDIVENNEKTRALQMGVLNNTTKIIKNRNRRRSSGMESSEGIGEERYLVIVVKQTFQHVRDHENEVVNFAILEVAGHHYDLGG